MDDNIHQQYIDHCNKATPRRPSRPFPPDHNATAAQFREHADKVAAFEAETEAYTAAYKAHQQEKSRLYDKVLDSIIAEYRDSGLSENALQYIFNYASVKGNSLAEIEEYMGQLVTMYTDVRAIEMREI